MVLEDSHFTLSKSTVLANNSVIDKSHLRFAECKIYTKRICFVTPDSDSCAPANPKHVTWGAASLHVSQTYLSHATHICSFTCLLLLVLLCHAISNACLDTWHRNFISSLKNAQVTWASPENFSFQSPIMVAKLDLSWNLRWVVFS